MRPFATTPTIVWCGSCGSASARPFAEGCGIRKVAAGESLVDDGDRRRLAVIGGAEVAALDQRQAEHFEVARSNGAKRKFGRLTRFRGNRLAFDDDARGPVVAGERNAPGIGGVLDAGESLDAIQGPPMKFAPVISSEVTLMVRTCVCGIPRARSNVDHGADKQAGADQQAQASARSEPS